MRIIGRRSLSSRSNFDDVIKTPPLVRYAKLALSAVRAPPLLAGVAAAATFLFALSAYILFKAREVSPTHGTNEQTKAVVAAAVAQTIHAPTEPDVTANWTVLEPAYKSYKIQVGNDNSLQADRQAIELYGIHILPRNQICTYRNGERWACGQRTYIALLNILGAATVDCRPHITNQPRIVACHLGGSDIAELLLREGWATVASGLIEQRYINAAAAAVAAKTGMWRLQPAK